MQPWCELLQQGGITGTHTRSAQKFFKGFGAFGVVWFVFLPFIVFVGYGIPPWQQERVETVVQVCMQALQRCACVSQRALRAAHLRLYCHECAGGDAPPITP